MLHRVSRASNNNRNIWTHITNLLIPILHGKIIYFYRKYIFFIQYILLWFLLAQFSQTLPISLYTKSIAFLALSLKGKSRIFFYQYSIPQILVTSFLSDQELILKWHECHNHETVECDIYMQPITTITAATTI